MGFKDERKVLSSGKSRKGSVLAERNPAVVPVGAWVEIGAQRQEHPGVRTENAQQKHIFLYINNL